MRDCFNQLEDSGNYSVVLQANQMSLLLSKLRKERRRPKASYHSVLVEGNIDD